MPRSARTPSSPTTTAGRARQTRRTVPRATSLATGRRPAPRPTPPPSGWWPYTAWPGPGRTTGWPPSSDHQVQALQQEQGDDGPAGAAPPPQPIVDEEKWGRWVSIQLGSVANIGQRDHDKVEPGVQDWVVHRSDEFGVPDWEPAGCFHMIRVSIDDHEPGVRSEPPEAGDGAWEQPAADNGYAVHWSDVAEGVPERTFVGAQQEALEQSRPQGEPFEAGQAKCIEPSQDRRPPASLPRARQGGRGQVRPVGRRAGGVLDVVPVVEEQPIVQPAVMTGGAAGVVGVPVQPAPRQPARVPHQVSGHKPRGVDHQHYRPEAEDEGHFHEDVPAQPRPPREAGVVSQVHFPPGGLRNAEDQGQVASELPVRRPRPKERP